jgi:V8-like Glu-specific endopeptidase
MNQKKKLTFYVKDVLHSINIDKDSKIYSSIRDKYDMMIIRLKEGEVNNYLEIDENIFKDDSVYNYKNESIYILHHPNAEEAKVSFGSGIEKENDYDIKHKCHTEPGSSGGPILSKMTNKVIGIHKGSIGNKYNLGTFLRYPLNDLKRKKKVSNNIYNVNIVPCK